APAAVGVAGIAPGPDVFWLRYPVEMRASAGLSSGILVMLMGLPRICYAMSRDGLLPTMFGKVYSRFRTPYISTICTGLVAMLIAGFAPIYLLGEMVSIGTLLAFVNVCTYILDLRYTWPVLVMSLNS